MWTGCAEGSLFKRIMVIIIGLILSGKKSTNCNGRQPPSGWYFTGGQSGGFPDWHPISAAENSSPQPWTFFSFLFFLPNSIQRVIRCSRDCTVYCISCFSKRIRPTSILLSRRVALSDLTGAALAELKCYDEYLNWNWFYNLSVSPVSLRPEPSDINRCGHARL